MSQRRASLREVAAELRISHGAIIILERRALAKLVIGLGIMTVDELPWRLRKHLPASYVARLRRPT